MTRMSCKEFGLWLKTRDIKADARPQMAAVHMEDCPVCRRLFQCDTRLEKMIEKGFSQQPLPEDLPASIDRILDHQEKKNRNTHTRRLAMGTATLAALVLLAMVFFPFSPAPLHRFKDLNQVSAQAVTDHLHGNRHMNFNASQIDQAIEMLTRELGFQVLLPDLEAKGCILLGGRLCRLGNCRAAYFIIEKAGKKGSLFIMDNRNLSFDIAEKSRFETYLKGCQADVWKENGQVYAMVF